MMMNLHRDSRRTGHYLRLLIDTSGRSKCRSWYEGSIVTTGRVACSGFNSLDSCPTVGKVEGSTTIEPYCISHDETPGGGSSAVSIGTNFLRAPLKRNFISFFHVLCFVHDQEINNSRVVSDPINGVSIQWPTSTVGPTSLAKCRQADGDLIHFTTLLSNSNCKTIALLGSRHHDFFIEWNLLTSFLWNMKLWLCCYRR